MSVNRGGEAKETRRAGGPATEGNLESGPYPSGVVTVGYPVRAGGRVQGRADAVGSAVPPSPSPALYAESFPVACPAGPPAATCRACQGHGVIHLLIELQALDRSRASVLAGIRQLAVEFDQVAPGAYLRPDGLVVYGVDTGRRLIDQPGYEPPRPRALRHLQVVR